jgi:hypothetical protein
LNLFSLNVPLLKSETKDYDKQQKTKDEKKSAFIIIIIKKKKWKDKLNDQLEKKMDREREGPQFSHHYITHFHLEMNEPGEKKIMKKRA